MAPEATAFERLEFLGDAVLQVGDETGAHKKRFKELQIHCIFFYI